MNRLNHLLAFALLLAALPAHADLVKVFENIRGTTVHVDTSTLTPNGDKRRVIEIQNYREPGPRGLLSMRLLKEYDCKNETAQIIAYTMYAGRMATGEMVGRVETPGELQKLTQNPGGTGGFRFACGR
jgi:hypothetical protein